MAGRIRTIKPELLEDARTAGLSESAFRLFIGLILLADDHGNLRAQEQQLYGAVFWARKPSRDIRECLAELSDGGLIRLYDVRGQRYAHLSGWAKHQRVDKPSRPRVPTPNDEGAETLANHSRGPRETLAPDLRSPISDPDPLYVSLLEYLNQKAGTKWRPVESHLKHFRTRLKSHSPEDIKRVIDTKVAEWAGTEMARYLVPETLLRPKNFDKYLDQMPLPVAAKGDHVPAPPREYGKNIPKAPEKPVDPKEALEFVEAMKRKALGR